MNGALLRLHAQASALVSNVEAVIVNKPEPARQVVIYMLMLIALAFIIPKIIKLVSK